MKPTIEIVSERLLPFAVADEIIASVNEAISDHGKCSIVLSGGKTPATIYRALSRPPRVSEIDWDCVNIFWGDERWVPQDDDQSNFRMTSETLLTHLNSSRPGCFPIDTSLASPDAAALAYEDVIRSTEDLNEEGMPEFDLVLLGMGEDGHVASLFPGKKSLKEKKRICLAVDDPSGEGARVTLTVPALFSAKRLVYIVRGNQKADMVVRALESLESPQEVPARFYQEAAGQVTWFVDSSAASKLTQTE